MNRFLVYALVFCVVGISAPAGEPVAHVYRGEIAGVVCASCASHVKTALSKLDGVRSVTITLPEGGGVPRLEIVSTSETITREQAVKALDSYAKMYDLRSLRMEK